MADVLALYGSERAPALAHPELVGYHMTHLLEHFGGSVCAQIDGGSCRAYVRQRTAGAIGRRAVSEGTARRELETLNAALGYAYKERKISLPIPVTYPAKAPARERWLTRSEAAGLLAGALGIVPVAYEVGSRKPVKWGRMHRPVYHVARFILIALYTGTRHDAILNMRWGVNSEGGWFDLDHGVMYRRGQGQRETNKRRPPAPVPDNLVPHLRRWRRITVQGPVEYAGRLILKERRGFKRARELAGTRRGRDAAYPQAHLRDLAVAVRCLDLGCRRVPRHVRGRDPQDLWAPLARLPVQRSHRVSWAKAGRNSKERSLDIG